MNKTKKIYDRLSVFSIKIDVDDLRWILKSLGDDLTEEEIDEMIRDTDRDGSGFVDFDGKSSK